MTNFLARYWKTLAAASASIGSSYLFRHCNESQDNHRVLSVLTLQAAQPERRNVKTWMTKHRYLEDENDEKDDEDEKTDRDRLESNDENVGNLREKRFREFGSVEYNGEIYMTPVDFLESLISDQPQPRIGRRHLTDETVCAMLSKTPTRQRGSNRFFRNLGEAGLISFWEYLFLCVILIKPASQIQIAFKMFDTDCDQLVGKHEFLVISKIITQKRLTSQKRSKHSSSKSKSTINTSSYYNLDRTEPADTSLLVHLFGKNGRDTLTYEDFKRFTENFQQEILEIEFNQFSHGFKAICDLDFTEMILRYTDLPDEIKRVIFRKVKQTTDGSNRITLDEFKRFSGFLKHLEDFNIAMRFHQLSNKPISQAEFQRAVKISVGFELDPHIIGLIFRIFDIDNDQHLSYDEFMGVMKDRLARGFRTRDLEKSTLSKFDQFKLCLREHGKQNTSA
ncbi:unnamed protein product [Adineta ricciae]|uniref:EF-hand domain-containing protein n=1 Tax=Adineta ricciae TaxID=249248 RepID=A0A815QSA0_ADIRI|nr:unnamed protein product [Adineta ricciae]CAF1466302.1 unnamed protein product [Adineta ricciae]